MRTAIFVALLTVCTTAVAAPGAPEQGQMEWSLGLTYNFDTNIAGVNGSSIDFDGQTGFELGFDYFVLDKLSLGFDMNWYRPDYDAVLQPEDGGPEVYVSYEANVFTGQFNGTYNFTDTAFTPFIEGGLGWTYIDSNVADGPPTQGCWWDPWWGYMCANFYESYSDTNFSYFGGLGIRWNISYDISVKASYRWLGIDSSNAAETPLLESALLEIAYHF